MKLIRKKLINGQALASGYKGNISSSSITDKNWGTEVLDNTLDYHSTESEIEVLSRYKDSGYIEKISFTNNGLTMTEEDSLGRFIEFPVVPYEYEHDTNGVKGAGKKKEECKGYLPTVYFTGEDGFVRLLKKTPCYDHDGTKEAVVEDISQREYINKILCDKVELYKTEIPNEKIFPSGSGVKLEFYFWSDSVIKINLEHMKQLAWTRFSNVKNFKVKVKDVNGDVENHKKAYFRMLDDNDSLITDYSDLEKVPGILEFKIPNSKDKIPYELYYGYSISQVNDKLKFDLWKSKMTNGIEFRHPYLPDSKDASVPTLNILGKKDVVLTAYGREIFWNSGFKDYTGIVIFVRPTIDIGEYVSADKSTGFTSNIRSEFCKSIKKEVKKHCKKTPYLTSQKQRELSEVEQFVSAITGNSDKSKNIRNSFKLLAGYGTKELKNKTNWSQKTLVRDFDLVVKTGNSTDAFEFQASNEPSDFRHMDGINARIDLLFLNGNVEHRNFYWVAESHSHAGHLKELLIKKADVLNNTHFENIFFLTSEQAFNGFDDDDVMTINIKKDILGK
tara:strand:- start:97 stop:1776 length:1680 start_codon:yes stop_codon:yes gene_type:complete